MIVCLVQAPPPALNFVEWRQLDNSILEIGLFEGERIYKRDLSANLVELHVRSKEQLAEIWSATPAGAGADLLTPGEGRARGLVSEISTFKKGREAKKAEIDAAKDKKTNARNISI
jgi:hypothetical protein